MEDMMSYLTQCNIIILKLKTEALPNPITFLLESQQIIEKIKTKSEIFLQNVILVAQKMSQFEFLNRPSNSSDSASNYLVANDPGKRILLQHLLKGNFLYH